MKDLHVGMIMDGNRRFAKRLMLEPWKGHEYGMKKIEDVLKWCKELDVKELTLYAFSIQNFNRPKHEFDYLMNLFRKEFKRINEEKENEISKNNLRVRFLGRRDLFPEDIQKQIGDIEKKTSKNDGYYLNFCFGYGGREEIVDAVHRIAEDIKSGEVQPSQVDEELIDNYVYNASQPDLVIRTGGDNRTSNFLVWQTAYSEWFFIKKFWPELTREDLEKIFEEFKKRERRFGK